MSTPSIKLDGKEYKLVVQLPSGGKTTLQFVDSANDSQVLVSPVGIGAPLNGIQYFTTTPSTISNSIVETSVLGTGVGSNSLSENTVVAGSLWRINAEGVMGASNLEPTITFKAKFGSTVLSTSENYALENYSGMFISINIIARCVSVGASGQMITSGCVQVCKETGYFPICCKFPTTVATIDTTNIASMDLTAKWSAADALNTLTLSNIIIERLR